MTTTDHDTIEGLGTILGVWAHPDDEAYLMAGTAMLAMASGATVACVTATAGEAGETADEDRWPQRELADIRREEMRLSLGFMGIDDHAWFGLPDGGLADVDDASGVGKIAEVAERVQPDTILTFGRDGMTGHPDHIVIGDWAEEVARERGVRVLAATKTQRWYEEYPQFNDVVFPDGGPCHAPGELALEVRLPDDVLDRKVDALRSQASQTSGLVGLLGEEVYRDWNRTEFWVDR